MRPVVLRGLSSKWRWRRRWQRQVFVKKFHEHNFSCADVPYKSQFLRKGAEGGTEQMRLGEFLQLSDEAEGQDGTRAYIFESIQRREHREFLSDVPDPPSFLTLSHEGKPVFTTAHTQFFLGPAGSGAPPHYHKHAWNALAYGRKRWFLWPPAAAMYSSMPIRRWLEEVLPGLPPHLAPLEVTQEAGDVIFVPAGWGHATLNLAASVGLSEEFDVGAAQWAEGPPE